MIDVMFNMCLAYFAIYYIFTVPKNTLPELQNYTKTQNGTGAGNHMPYLFEEFEIMKIPKKLRYNINIMHT